ncbi:c-type cytochrome [Maritalea porphyrae]|uniref:Cytochrome c domain-containing protein n=1 Tax=Maritalea porphyrae TaxID=880732 RepID=A0ABQ5UMX1_9HYPH|nr:c-type cytochrome [Maritalea porphyrae]GLQ15923.1 hypothetical protein GCM10007879_01720 [Maritalea porphyrae]
MLKYLKSVALGALVCSAFSAAGFAQGDVDKGKKVFNKCKACHMVGDKAKNKSGPELNELFGRAAGSKDGFKYSKAMLAKGEDGLVWNEETLNAFLTKPKAFVKGTKMSFAGIKKQKDMDNLLAYLGTFSTAEVQAPVAEQDDVSDDANAPAVTTQTNVAASAAEVPEHGVFHLGRVATDDEIAAWDFDVRPDGMGLPNGRGTVADGEEVFVEKCASCHGDFGEGVGRWPVLAGGQNSLQNERPVKTIGSYWPYLSTVYDYVQRAMPFGEAASLTDDETYAITAYLLYLNDIVDDEEFELSKENFLTVEMPNTANFYADDREDEPQYSVSADPCMNECKVGPVEITKRAQVLDVTPDQE